MSNPRTSLRRITAPEIRAKKGRERIVMVTAYDATFARMADEADVDAILVGDSLGMVIQGLDTTLPVTVDEVVYHCRAVTRGAVHAHIIADMPFMSYQVTAEEALRNAGRFIQEGSAHAVKLEGGEPVANTVARIVNAGIPVMGHIGLTPQSVHAMGGFRVQGKTVEQAERLREDARVLEEAGAYAIVLEGMPIDLAAEITDLVTIPTIGIGAGPSCDGQVLVGYDLLGLTTDLRPKFVKRYEELFERGVAATRLFRDEVRNGTFPAPEHGFGRVMRTEGDVVRVPLRRESS
jgi:3-methyl-2-oxobutanoate hydroxymethyltransferase